MKKLLILLIAIVLIISCKSNKQPETDTKPIVTASILPQKYFIDRIVNGKIDVNVMVPEGSDPHIYEPSAKQMKDLSNSNAYFKMGHIEFELAWMSKFAALNPSMKIVNLSKNALLIEPENLHDDHDHEDHGHHHGVDPHIWSSPLEVKKICKLLVENLVVLYPDYKDEFETNYKTLISEIDSLDLSIKEKLKTIEGKKFMIYHSALAYFARDYNLEQISIETDGKEPSPIEIKNIIELAQKENIRVILFKSNLIQIVQKF